MSVSPVGMVAISREARRMRGSSSTASTSRARVPGGSCPDSTCRAEQTVAGSSVSRTSAAAVRRPSLSTVMWWDVRGRGHGRAELQEGEEREAGGRAGHPADVRTVRLPRTVGVDEPAGGSRVGVRGPRSP
jgi:hypothetical protein